MNEVMKCRDDFAYFLTKYVFLQNPATGRVEFEVLPYHLKLVEMLNEDEQISVLQARQIGISSFYAAYFVWKAAFHDVRQFGFVGHSQQSRITFRKKVEFIIAELPPYLRPGPESNFLYLSRHQVPFKGYHLDILFVDLLDHMKNQEDLIEAVFPCVIGGQLILSSSLNSDKDFFYTNHQKALSGLNDFSAVTLPWWVDVRRMKDYPAGPNCLGMTKEQIRKEYECTP